MSYGIAPPVNTSGFVSNPLTAELVADDNDVSGVGTITASVGDMSQVSIADAFTTEPTAVVGLYGVPPTPQFDPIPDVVPSNPEGEAINSILEALRRVGVIGE